MAVYSQVCTALKGHNVEVIASQEFETVPRCDESVWNWIDQNNNSSWLNEMMSIGVDLTYPVRYQLEACISQGILNAHNMTRKFTERLATLQERDAVQRLEHVAEKKSRVYNPMDIFDMAIPLSSRQNKIPPYCIKAQSVTLTPSAMYVNTPTVETSNRIIRQYQEHGNRFLRVRFSDEKHEGRIRAAADDGSYDAVYTRVFRCLKNGIKIGDRHFEFLAMGNAQFREHGAYFFAPTIYQSAEDIRRQMGDFQPIRSISKYASRMGQCFSTTRAINIRPVLKEIADTMRNGYNFTDGVGKISLFMAQNIAHELGLPVHSDPPCAFQFRMGGCKGMLAVDPKAKDRDVYIRPSQYKFAAQQNGLEVIRWSSFAAAKLNRQLIIVLKSIGIDDQVFIDKMKVMLERLSSAMEDEQIARDELLKQIDFNQMTVAIVGIMNDGFMKVGDPFATSILHLWRAYMLKALKEKAQLMIPQGAFLLGCSDETATLRGHFEGLEGTELPEVFVQISDSSKNDGSYKVIEGVCIVARNPSLHPGDIRIVRAVPCDALLHLKNVVVFPQTGDRDIPNMCSGGDLDGDDFVIIWDSELIPPDGNRKAMDFTPEKSKELDRDVKVQDIFPFFVNYMKTDSLGGIANAHLAHADSSSRGVDDVKCKFLKHFKNPFKTNSVQAWN